MKTIKRLFFHPWFHRVMIGLLLVDGLILAIAMASSQASGQISSDGITMLDSSIPVNKTLQERALTALAIRAPARGVFTYAITSVDQRGPYYMVSVAGFGSGVSSPWSLDNATWLGVVTLPVTPDIPGMVENDSLEPTSGPSGPEMEMGGSGDILPFMKGTQAQYGELGIHACGFGLGDGWKAVDLFPADNTVYAAQSGEISYICRDGTQMSIRIGEHMYVHLIDTGIAPGVQVEQGSKISELVKGTFSATCGNAQQNENHGHVHFCFVPYDNSYSADGYTLNTLSGHWTKGEDTVEELGYLTAEWIDANVTPPASLVGSNFWDELAVGYTTLVTNAASVAPDHAPIGLADRVLTIAAIPLALVYATVLVNFKMTIVIWVFGIIMVLETVRIAYSAYMWIKRAIPVIG